MSAKKHNFAEYLKLKKQREHSGTPNGSPVEEACVSKEPVRPIEEVKPSWDNYAALEKLYTESSALPPLLSPQIPNRYTEPTIPTMLSPTLPPKYAQRPTPPPSSSSSAPPSEVNKVWNNGRNSYTHVRNPQGKSLKVTIHVPKWFKAKNVVKRDEPKTKTNSSIGLGLTVKKTKKFPTEKDKYLTKFQEYLEIAKEMKHKADARREKDVKLAIATFIDCIVVYLVGFHYEDQHRRLSKKLYNEKTWQSLVSLVDHVNKLALEAQDDDMTGLCLQIKCVVYEHICRILDEYIQLDMVKRKKCNKDQDLLAIDSTMVEHMKTQIRYRELSRRSLERSEQYLSIFTLIEKYPQLIKDYQLQAEGLEPVMDPSKDQFQLPITQAVTIPQLGAYSLRLLRQWCDRQKVSYEDWLFK
jgi:hypothetical protein